jgi:hypothetical protein
MTVPLLRAETLWECPNCPARHMTTEAAPHIPFHECPGLRGLLAPYVRAGTRCKVEAVERADYAGTEAGLRTDATGRVISAVVTTRGDGQDCAVFPGTASALQED